jgi:hypothetical protein
MKIFFSTSRWFIVGFSLLLMASGAFAGKPDWASAGKYKEHDDQKVNAHKHLRKDHVDKNHIKPSLKSDNRRFSLTLGFKDKERRTIRDYYGQQPRKGHCPPGLAKKNNGCLPPGQAKKWQKGRQINHDARYYGLPHELLIRLPLPPINHEYIRIASDVLLVTVGTKIVVDVIEDIFR